MLNDDIPGINEVTSSLPEWFDADARMRSIPIDLCHQTVYVAENTGLIVGFITLYVAEGRLIIGWLGVKSDRQRSGIGKLLLNAAEEFGRDLNLKEISTYTLGEGVDYWPYKSTRAFYYSQGFHIYQRSITDNKGCPEEIKIKKTIGH